MSSLLLVKSPWSEWKIETVLGKGSFGTVYRAVRTEGENRYYSAIKHISIPDSQQEIDNAVKSGVNSDTDSLNQFFEGIANTYINEIKTMYQLRGNTNIVLYEDHKMHRKENGVGFDIYIRMELLQPITEYWKNRTPQDTEIARLGADICTAVSLCCAKGIIHRDIKPSNIYVSDSGSFKLGDFGSSVLYRDIKNGNTISGATPAYLAPELSLGKSTFSEQTDIYALGLVLYRLLNNDLLPFMSAENINNQEYAELAIVRRNSGERIPAPANGNPALKSLFRIFTKEKKGDIIKEKTGGEQNEESISERYNKRAI